MNAQRQSDEAQAMEIHVNMPKRFNALVRFGVVGVFQNGLSLILILVVLRMGLEPWQVFALTFPISVTFTYWLNSRWSFAGRSRRKAAPVAYAGVYVAAYFLSIWTSYGLQLLGVQGWLNAVITILVIGGFTFVAVDRSVFGDVGPHDHG